jgi:general secretion pathway protein D
MRAWLICAVSLVGLSACSPAYLEQRTDEAQNAADVVRAADLRPRFPTPVRGEETQGSRGGGFTVFGSSASQAAAEAPAAEAPSGAAEAGDGYTLNFEGAPVANVAKVVLGDILSLSYTIDSRAQAAISLSSSRPIPKRDLLFVLESALRANNIAMIREAGGYRIAPIAEGGAFGPADRADSRSAAAPGYGMTVIPLHYVAGPTIVRLIDGFATRPGTVRADPSGRLILVVGTGEERRAALNTVQQFDVDWLRGQSVGLYPVRNTTSAAIAGELENIMDSKESGMGHGLVKVQDVVAQNAVLVVAARPAMLQAAANWIRRLDSPDVSGAGVHVYKVRYGDAKQIAQLLTAMFGGGGAGGESDVNQLAPGAGAKQLSAADRLTGGPQSNPGASLGATPGGGSGPSSQPPGGASSPFGGLRGATLSAAFASAGQGGGSSPILPGVRITADGADNSLLIYAGADSYRIIERAVQQLDRPKAQVAIDVTIAEVTLNDQLNYGVQFYLTSHFGSLVNSGTGLPMTPSDAPPGFNVFVGNLAAPHAIINALHQLTDVKILSNPSLVVVDNQEATLEVGDQVPVSTGSATVLSANNAVVNTIDYKNTGIILDVIPRVSPDNTIQLDISQEISNVVNNVTAGSPAAVANSTTPTISERKVKSEITVASGQMVLLAGLVSETQTKARNGMPLLDQLPLVGGAFGSSDKQRTRTELIMLIKPQIIRDSVDAAHIAEQLRAKMRGGRIDAISLPNALQINAKRGP